VCVPRNAEYVDTGKSSATDAVRHGECCKLAIHIRRIICKYGEVYGSVVSRCLRGPRTGRRGQTWGGLFRKELRVHVGIGRGSSVWRRVFADSVNRQHPPPATSCGVQEGR